MIKHIIIIVLCVFTFVGNIGLAIFTHSCSVDGTSQSIFFPEKHHCQIEKQKTNSCCKSEVTQNTTKQIQTKTCCSDQIDLFHISFEYADHYKTIKITQPTFLYAKAFHFELNTPSEYLQVIHNYCEPPPKLSGKSLLIQNQVFRI